MMMQRNLKVIHPLCIILINAVGHIIFLQCFKNYSAGSHSFKICITALLLRSKNGRIKKNKYHYCARTVIFHEGTGYCTVLVKCSGSFIWTQN